MKKIILSSLFGIALVSGAAAHAFFDEIVALREELHVWQTTHAADFKDIVAQLDDITGSVFHDVQESDWFNPYVSSLAEWGIVSGYKDATGNPTGDFYPGNQVSVAEVLKMSLEAAQVDLSQCDNAPRNSHATGHWSSKYVACAERMNMRMFRFDVALDRPVRRAEVLAIVHDSFQDTVPALYAAFSDSQGHLLEADIAYASVEGIISGDTDANGNQLGTFRPNDTINRAEVAKIVYEKLKGEARMELQI